MARLSAAEEELEKTKAEESIGEGEKVNPAADEQPATSPQPSTG